MEIANILLFCIIVFFTISSLKTVKRTSGSNKSEELNRNSNV